MKLFILLATGLGIAVMGSLLYGLLLTVFIFGWDAPEDELCTDPECWCSE